MANETYEQQMKDYVQQLKDSDQIFTAISSGDFDDFKQAEQAVVMLYVMDMSFSRAGICHALKRLERFYEERSNASVRGEPQGESRSTWMLDGTLIG